MEKKLSEIETMELPKWYQKMPFVNDWVKYKGEIYFAMINFERTETARKPMIDLCYCATRGLNGVVLRTVQYDKNKFQIHQF